MSAKSSISALRNIKAQSGTKLNKIASALNRGDISKALKYVEQHRELNARMAYDLTKFAKLLRVD